MAASGRITQDAVDVLQLDGGTAALVPAPAGLAPDAGFGASVALSGDGRVLLASTDTSVEPAAYLYEWSDGGYQQRLKVPAPRELAFVGVTLMTPVAVSLDGQTAAVGFPSAKVVVIARRVDGGWAADDALFSGDESSGYFGNGVSLSRDGSRAAVVCPACTDALVIFERAP